MHFTIITTSYKRPILLKRCINSITNQSYSNWNMIIVDDSWEDSESLINLITDKRIKYIKNKDNYWSNYSKNIALDNISNTDFIIYLDDDDYFSKECLREAYKTITKNNNYNWYISNRINENWKSITSLKKKKNTYNYEKDHFFYNNLKWDVTHCFRWNKVKKYRYSKIIKNWLTISTSFKNERKDIYLSFLELKEYKILNFKIIIYLLYNLIHNIPFLLNIKSKFINNEIIKKG